MTATAFEGEPNLRAIGLKTEQIAIEMEGGVRWPNGDTVGHMNNDVQANAAHSEAENQGSATAKALGTAVTELGAAMGDIESAKEDTTTAGSALEKAINEVKNGAVGNIEPAIEKTGLAASALQSVVEDVRGILSTVDSVDTSVRNATSHTHEAQTEGTEVAHTAFPAYENNVGLAFQAGLGAKENAERAGNWLGHLLDRDNPGAAHANILKVNENVRILEEQSEDYTKSVDNALSALAEGDAEKITAANQSVEGTENTLKGNTEAITGIKESLGTSLTQIEEDLEGIRALEASLEARKLSLETSLGKMGEDLEGLRALGVSLDGSNKTLSREQNTLGEVKERTETSMGALAEHANLPELMAPRAEETAVKAHAYAAGKI